MPGWLSEATVAASLWNRWRKLVSLEYCSASTLIATGMSRRGWVERYTTPMAPRPSSASIGYRPSCVVVTFGLGGTQYAGRYRPNPPIAGGQQTSDSRNADGAVSLRVWAGGCPRLLTF